MTTPISKVKISETQDKIISFSLSSLASSCWQSEGMLVTGTIAMCKELEGQPDKATWLDFLSKKYRFSGKEHGVHMPEK